MKRISISFLIALLVLSLAACGGGGDESAGEQASSGGQDAAQQDATPIVLETPTPKPAPPTPTPKPTRTPVPEPAVELVEADAEAQESTEEAAEETAEEAAPAEEATETEAVEAEPTPEPMEAAPAPMIDSAMVEVPAGPFVFGSNDGNPENAPEQSVELAGFMIDKFEVTNDDFAMFVEQTGYQTDAEKSGSQSWLKYAEGQPGHPVVKVTWNDAVAFCEWAGKRLPTEQEWEKAARGDAGLAFPWGADFDASLANVKDTGLRGTTAVGSFPGGASPYGVEDIAGNVWEWTASWYQAYDGGSADNPYYGEKFRVTRGGAWFEEGPQVSAFNRNAADPDITANDDLGFRCVKDM